MEIKTPTIEQRNQRTWKTPSRTILRKHPKELTNGGINHRVQNRKRDMKITSRSGMALLSTLETKDFIQACKDELEQSNE